ncbi:MAG: hypothetical protein HYS26_02680 [Candidatus Kaiserbacteria bacterium]|nr:MAG: hypothetical protein HYS26_02680 [Candidatus Kaiserbacteria bacterium]
MSLLNTKTRVVLATLAVLSAVFLSPWLTLILMGLLAFGFRAWEVLLIGLSVDLLWLPAGDLLDPLPIGTLIALALVWGLEPLRSQYLMSQ